MCFFDIDDGYAVASAYPVPLLLVREFLMSLKQATSIRNFLPDSELSRSVCFFHHSMSIV